MKTRYLFIFSLLLLALSALFMAACIHDILIMREKCDHMGEAIAEMKAENRQIKTDCDIMFHLVIDGEYLTGEK